MQKWIALVHARLENNPVIPQVGETDVLDRAQGDHTLTCRLRTLVDEVRHEKIHATRREKQKPRTRHRRATESRHKQLGTRAEHDVLTSRKMRTRAQHASLGRGAIHIEIVAHKATHTDQAEAAALFATRQQLVAVVAHLEELVSFATSAPCTLDAPRTFLAAPQVRTPRALNAHRHIVPVPITHRLQCKERLGVLDKALGHTQLPLVTSNARVDKDALTATACITLPNVVACIRGGRRKQIEALHNLFERVAVRKAGSAHADVFLQTKVLDLVQNRLGVVLTRALVLVRLDRANVRRLRLHKVIDQQIRARLDAVAGRGRALFAVRVGAIREQTNQKGIRRTVDQVQNVLEQCILVLLRHALDIVHDIARVVTDQELASTRLKVWVARQHRRALHERVIRRGRVRMSCHNRIVQRRENAWRALGLNQVTHNLVVEVLDRRPLNLLLRILFLLFFERQLNKDLLQLFIDIIDAQLLKGVVLKDLKAINVQHANHGGSLAMGLKRLVHTRDNPFEQIVVDGLAQRVTHGSRLCWVQWHFVYRSTAAATLRFHNALRQCALDSRRIYAEQIGTKVGHVGVPDVRVTLRVLGKVDISEPQDRSKHAHNAHLLILRETNRLHGLEGGGKIGMVVDAGHIETLAMGRVRVGLGTLQTKSFALLRRRSLRQLVEYVEVALVSHLTDHAPFFQQVVGNLGAHRRALRIKHDFEVLAVPRAIVVAERLCASKALEQGIGRQHHVFDVVDASASRAVSTDSSDVLHNPLSRLRLAST